MWENVEIGSCTEVVAARAATAGKPAEVAMPAVAAAPAIAMASVRLKTVPVARERFPVGFLLGG
jgi:hypothetical protein